MRQQRALRRASRLRGERSDRTRNRYKPPPPPDCGQRCHAPGRRRPQIFTRVVHQDEWLAPRARSLKPLANRSPLKRSGPGLAASSMKPAAPSTGVNVSTRQRGWPENSSVLPVWRPAGGPHRPLSGVTAAFEPVNFDARRSGPFSATQRRRLGRDGGYLCSRNHSQKKPIPTPTKRTAIRMTMNIAADPVGAAGPTRPGRELIGRHQPQATRTSRLAKADDYEQGEAQNQ